LSQYFYFRSHNGEPLGQNWQGSHILLDRIGELDKDRGRAAAQMDIHGYLPEQLLPKTDLSTMFWSLEGREPLLDHRLAEFSVGIPSKLVMGKQPLKKILSRYVPEALWNRPKHAFDIPLDEWFRGSMVVKLDQLRDEWEDNSWLARRDVEKIIDEHLKQEKDVGGFLWTLMSFNQWRSNLSQFE